MKQNENNWRAESNNLSKEYFVFVGIVFFSRSIITALGLLKYTRTDFKLPIVCIAINFTIFIA